MKPGWIPTFAGMTTVLIITLFLTASRIQAAGYGLSLNPPLLRVNIKPGKSISQVFTITNLTGDDKLLVARLAPFTQADIYGNPVIDLKATPAWLNNFSLANTNIKLGNPFTVRGNSSEQLIVSMTIPETSPLRDIYATLLVSTYTNTLNQAFQGSQINATSGSNLLITINSEISPPTILKINHVAPISGAYYKVGNLYLADSITPISFSASVKNDGDFTTETKGIVVVMSRKEEPVYLDGILPVYVIAHTERELKNSEGNSFTFTPNLGNFGPHKIVVQIKTDNSNAENTIDVFFFPFKISIGLLVALIVLSSIVKLNPKNKSEMIDSV